MNNYCMKCGKPLNGQNICPECGTEVIEYRVDELNRPLAIKFIVIFIVLIILSYWLGKMAELDSVKADGLSNFYYWASTIAYTADLIFVIFAKKKLRYSVFFDVIFWLILGYFIYMMLMYLAILVACHAF